MWPHFMRQKHVREKRLFPCFWILKIRGKFKDNEDSSGKDSTFGRTTWYKEMVSHLCKLGLHMAESSRKLYLSQTSRDKLASDEKFMKSLFRSDVVTPLCYYVPNSFFLFHHLIILILSPHSRKKAAALPDIKAMYHTGKEGNERIKSFF